MRFLVALTFVLLAGCGLDVQSPDIFLITRVGQGSKLTLLVNNGGFARCNGGKSKAISSGQLISARDLSDNLQSDASNGLTIDPTAHTVYTYTIRMQPGTIRFPDVAAGGHRYLAQAEFYFVRAMQGICHISA
jgi:hypothetical protein